MESKARASEKLARAAAIEDVKINSLAVDASGATLHLRSSVRLPLYDLNLLANEMNEALWPVLKKHAERFTNDAMRDLGVHPCPPT